MSSGDEKGSLISGEERDGSIDVVDGVFFGTVKGE